MFQIARGSRATLSECTFFFKKRTSPKRLFQDKTTSRTHDKKKPDRAISKFFLIKNPGTCSRTFQRRIRAISRQDPPAPCTKQQEARGLHPKGSTFFFKKVHTTRRSHKVLHGFAQESTQTTLVPARQDLKEQDEASRAQP